MNFEQLEKLEKYFEKTFNETLFYVSENNKNAHFIEDLDKKVQSEILNREGYQITKPKRTTSIFQNKCKRCQKAVLKNMDLSIYYRYNYCYECFVRYEELKHGKK